MWKLLEMNQAQTVVSSIAGGFLLGWLLAWAYFRQRIWVMQQRLRDYSERRATISTFEEKRLTCPVCRSHSLHRSNKLNFSVITGMLFGRTPYRCERCFTVSLQKGPSLYARGKRVDTYGGLAGERQQFASDLRVARKMKRVYPQMFDPGSALKRSQPPR